MTNKMHSEEKIALVTGASRGIGKAIVGSLAARGVTVIGTEINEEGAQSISESLNSAGFKGCGKVLNVTDQASIDVLIKDIKAEFGTIDILVNNAGITKDNLMMRMSDEEWDAVINTNLNSIYRMTKACLRDMMKSRWGRIINISSVVGSIGNAGQANYCASKAGMIGFTKSLAQEIASRNITVNAIAPGFIDTAMTQKLDETHREALLGMIPMKRMGTPEDIASSVLFLASKHADYITGQTIHVNGGMCMF
jgi:3-oxoacyl-[acyl-carrier protein] reductase